MIDFEAHSYTAIPDLDVASLLALGTALANAMPRPLPDELRKPVKKLRSALATLMEASAVLPKPGANRDLADARVDAAWEALHARLSAYDDLPHDTYPEVGQARDLVARVFPEGLSFLTLPHNAEWVESDKRLRAIDAEGLASKVEALAGAMFLREVRAAHAAYGEALGIAIPRVSLSAPQLVGPALELRKSMQRYARAVVGLVDEDELATVAMAETALRPILEVVRAWVRSHADSMFHVATGSAVVAPIADTALLSAGARYGASDVHLKVDDPPIFRINGQLTPLQHDRLRPTDLDALVQIVGRSRDPNIKVAELQDLDCSYQVEGVGRFRVNVYRQRGALSIVMRFIPRDVPTIDGMFLPPALKKIAETERGLILVTGATGSGKSSTLAAMLRHINSTRRCHILTIEDPIEFLHTSNVAVVSQRELGSDTKTFGGALRSALRQDPDVIMVGEMRDAESIDIGLKAGETGHVVYSTVHTTDAAKTLGRLLGVFSAEEQRTVTYRIADTLKATISQRLLPRADGRGRVAACEIMVVTNTIREHLAEGRPASGLRDLMQRGGDAGMQTFDQHLSKLYQAGVITLQAAMEASTNPADFQRALHFQ